MKPQTETMMNSELSKNNKANVTETMSQADGGLSSLFLEFWKMNQMFVNATIQRGKKNSKTNLMIKL
jgi:hypothetical protein